MNTAEGLYCAYLRGYLGCDQVSGSSMEASCAFALGVHHREIKAAPVHLRGVSQSVREMRETVGGNG